MTMWISLAKQRRAAAEIVFINNSLPSRHHPMSIVQTRRVSAAFSLLSAVKPAFLPAFHEIYELFILERQRKNSPATQMITVITVILPHINCTATLSHVYTYINRDYTHAYINSLTKLLIGLQSRLSSQRVSDKLTLLL